MIKKLIWLFVIIILFSCGTKCKRINKPETFINFDKPKGVSFELDNVQIADSLLPVDSALKIFENKIGKQILFYPNEQQNYGLVNCNNNGFIETIQLSYSNHRPLILTPDVLWLTICQGVSIHINQNFDSLKKVLFIKNKPDEIVIRNDSLEYSEKHWQKLIGSFSVETKKYTNQNFYSFFVPKFTTTSTINTTAYQITMLESYKKAFVYVGESGCGIPSITITGETKDWQSIYNRLDMLSELGLSKWAENLKPIIKQFINASENKINITFWKDIYKNASEYNAFYISGWAIKLFPYIKILETSGEYDSNRDATRLGEKFVPNPFLYDDDYLKSTLASDNFPTGISKISVVWNNRIKNYSKKIEVYAGFFAIKQYEDKSLEPLISYAICNENAKLTQHILRKINSSLSLKHNKTDWSPNFPDSITNPAIYDIKQLKKPNNSLLYIRKVILDSLKNTSFLKKAYHNDTLYIEVLSNGKIGHVALSKSKNSKLNSFLENTIKDLPKPWFPALTYSKFVIFDMDNGNQNALQKVRANSKLKIVL
jgi:hypothetical protein